MSAGLLWALLGGLIWGFQNVFSKRGMGHHSVLVSSWVSVVMGGTIASSKGSATAVPIPRRKVRRGRAFFVTIIVPSSFETVYC